MLERALISSHLNRKREGLLSIIKTPMDENWIGFEAAICERGYRGGTDGNIPKGRGSYQRANTLNADPG